MKKLILAAALVLCAAAPAAAQDEVPPGEQAVIREFLEVTRVRENFMLTIEAMLRGGMGEELGPEFADVMRRFFAEHFRYEDMEPAYIQMYADLFTEQELRDLVAFYRTPVGQRMVELTPDIAARTQQITSEIMEESMPELMQMIMESMGDEDMEMDVEAEKTPPPARGKS